MKWKKGNAQADACASWDKRASKKEPIPEIDAISADSTGGQQ
jgi:hypothetical protein